MIKEVNTDNGADCCPFMSGQPIPIAPPAGRVLQPNQMAVAPMAVPCAKEKCAAWDAVTNMCSVLSLAGSVDSVRELLGSIRCELSNFRMVFTPPEGSPSPLMRLAEAVEAIVKHQQNFWSLKKTRNTRKG